MPVGFGRTFSTTRLSMGTLMKRKDLERRLLRLEAWVARPAPHTAEYRRATLTRPDWDATLKMHNIDEIAGVLDAMRHRGDLKDYIREALENSFKEGELRGRRALTDAKTLEAAEGWRQ